MRPQIGTQVENKSNHLNVTDTQIFPLDNQAKGDYYPDQFAKQTKHSNCRRENKLDENKLNKTYLRTIQYWFEDGIVELGIGSLFLLLGIYFYLQATLENKVWVEQLSASFALVFILGWYLIDSFIRSAKERITFPRTGYVAYKPDKSNKKLVRLVLAIVVGVLVSAGLLVVFSSRSLPIDNLLPAATGLTITLVLGVMG